VLTVALLLALAGAAPPANEPCKAAGEATIAQKDRNAARTHAIERAMARCVAQVAVKLLEEGRVGGTLSPDERTRALSAIEPRIAKDPARLMKSHKVLTDRATGNAVRVEISGLVITPALIDLTREAALGLERSAARIGIVMFEAGHVGQRIEVSGNPLFAGQLGRLLHDRSYEVMPVPFDPGTEVELLDDVPALAKRARTAQIEIIIAGEVTMIDGDPTSPLAKTRPVTIEGRLQVVEARTGKLRGRVPIKAKIEASTLEKGLARALADGLLDTTFKALSPMLRVEATRESVEARVVQLSFAGLPDFRQGRAIIELLKLINGLAPIEERSFDDGKLEVEGKWVGEMDELESLVREEMLKHRGLQGLKVNARNADRIEWGR